MLRKIRRQSLIVILLRWSVWIFPVFALILAGYLFYDFYNHQGPLVTVSFTDAAGVEVGKTPLRYRGINVGDVEEIHLTDDSKAVIVKARLDREAEDLAVDGSKFTIVQPQVDFGGVRGLETLFKGPYIRIDPGHGGRQSHFKGATGDEMNESQSGVPFTLTTNLADSIDKGDPITYRGLKVGQVSNVKISDSAQTIEIHIRIEKKYHKLVRSNTVFWQAVAIQAKMGIFGGEVKVNSLESLLKSGVSLATPNGPGEIAKANTKFTIQKDTPKDWVSWSPVL